MKRIYCRLAEIMTERHISVKQLSRVARVDRGSIILLRRNTWKKVSRETIARICTALDIELSELLVLYDQDIWFPVKLLKEVVIHVGATAHPSPVPEMAAGSPSFDRRAIGLWDFRAFNLISHYLNRAVPGVRISFQEHMTGVFAELEPGVGDMAEGVFDEGNHVIIGAPISNQLTEETVCRAFGVAPYTPANRDAFPFSLSWDFPLKTASSFALGGPEHEAGIRSNATGKLVARRTFVAQGEGEDGALIVTYRVSVPPVRRRYGNDDERIIIWILGLSGPGTYAGAMVATRKRDLLALYPSAKREPRMAVVSAEYVRPAVDGRVDARKVSRAKLVAVAEECSQAVPLEGAARA